MVAETATGKCKTGLKQPRGSAKREPDLDEHKCRRVRSVTATPDSLGANATASRHGNLPSPLSMASALPSPQPLLPPLLAVIVITTVATIGPITTQSRTRHFHGSPGTTTFSNHTSPALQMVVHMCTWSGPTVREVVAQAVRTGSAHRQCSQALLTGSASLRAFSGPGPQARERVSEGGQDEDAHFPH